MAAVNGCANRFRHRRALNPRSQRRAGAPRKYLPPAPKHDSVRANTTWQRVANVSKLSFDVDYYVKGYL